MKAKKILFRVAVFAISLLLIYLGNKASPMEFGKEGAEYAQEFYKAKIVSIDHVNDINPFTGEVDETFKEIYFSAQILTAGKYGQKTITAVQGINLLGGLLEKVVEPGDVIVLLKSPYDNAQNDGWIFSSYYRADKLMILVGVFFVFIIIMGRSKGLTTILSLILTCMAIFFVFLPSILSGYNIYLTSSLVAVFITVSSLFMLDGANKKTAAAIFGNIGGTAVAGIIALIMNSTLNITGVVDEDYFTLAVASTSTPIDLRALVWSGILIGSLGAIMDVSMSIASSLQELAQNMRKPTFKTLFVSGMNIGRDAIGTMTNTLILAYIGGSLALVLLLIFYNQSILYLFSLEMIVVEVLQSIIGSMGIIAAVPITTVLAAYIFSMGNKNSGPRLAYSKGDAHAEEDEYEDYGEEDYGEDDEENY